MAKKYEEKYKQVAELGSKLTIEEARFREIEVWLIHFGWHIKWQPSNVHSSHIFYYFFHVPFPPILGFSFFSNINVVVIGL